MHRVPFQILDRVQADFLPHFVLQLSPGELGNQYLVFERADLQDQLVLIDPQQLAGDFGDQVRGWGLGTGGWWQRAGAGWPGLEAEPKPRRAPADAALRRSFPSVQPRPPHRAV